MKISKLENDDSCDIILTKTRVSSSDSKSCDPLADQRI